MPSYLELPYAIDAKNECLLETGSCPWATLAAAKAGIPLETRVKGLLVFVQDSAFLYWFRNGVADTDLIPAISWDQINGAVPTWNQNTTGNAATATLAANSTLWNDYANDFAAGLQNTITGPSLTDGILGMAENFVVYRYNNTAIAQYLGLNSAAYTDSGNYATAAQGIKADTAYSWGNHALAGYLTTINGITAGGELSGTYANPTLVNSAVTGKVLTGLSIVGGSISATDTILSAFGKLQNQISALTGADTGQGVWNASTNTPSLTSSVGTKGHYYIVNVAGSTNLDGISDWRIGDRVLFDGTVWRKIDNTDAVSSVNGLTGAVSLTTSYISEGSNLYFTDARSRAALSYTGGAAGYNSTTGVISIPTQTSHLTNNSSFISGSGTINTIPKFSASGTLTNSIITESGSRIRINGNGIEINGPATSYRELLFLTSAGARFNT